MVGAGEVDEDLEVETKEECEKYGKVGKCVIFEVRENLSFVLATPKVNCPFVFHVWHTTAVKEQQRISKSPLLCCDSMFPISVKHRF